VEIRNESLLKVIVSPRLADGVPHRTAAGTVKTTSYCCEIVQYTSNMAAVTHQWHHCHPSEFPFLYCSRHSRLTDVVDMLLSSILSDARNIIQVAQK